MKREQTNRIRFILEDCLPPIIRDMRLVNLLFSKLAGMDLQECRRLREKIPTLTAEELIAFYAKFPRVQDRTDNSAECIHHILKNLIGPSVCDVGCGTGYLLNCIVERKMADTLVGVDFSRHDEWKNLRGIDFIEHDIFNLPFENSRFDTVISTHTLQHVLDIPAAFGELRRICRQKLIIVVPRERECIYSFNPHFHYFPYEHSFLKFLLPLPLQWQIQRLGRDYLYTEMR